MRGAEAIQQRARAFDMTVLTADPYLSPEAAQSGGAELVALDDLLARADVISLHAPSTADTKHLMNRERLAKTKKGTRLINTARGELIDTGADDDDSIGKYVVWACCSDSSARDHARRHLLRRSVLPR
mgnify:CR=1 FL=1